MQKDTFPNACEYARASVWGLKISKARTLALVPSRAPLAPPRPVRPLALGSPALPPCSFTTVGSCSLTGDAPGTLTRVEGARRVAASGTRVRRQSFRRARATVARESIACVHTTASRRARGNRAMHPCTHAPMHACVQTTTQTIHADNRRAFRARVGRPVILSGSRARLEHHPRTTASPRPRPTRARTHTHTYHAHTPPLNTAPPRHRIARRTHKTPDASHRIASHRIASRSTPRTRSRLSRHRHARTDDARARRRRIRRKHIRVIHTSRRVWRRRSLRARGRRERAIVVFFARADGAPSRIGRRRRRIRIRDARRRARRTTPRLRRIKKKHSVSRDARTRTHTRVHTRAHTHTRGSRPRDVFRIRGTAHVRAHGCIRDATSRGVHTRAYARVRNVPLKAPYLSRVTTRRDTTTSRAVVVVVDERASSNATVDARRETLCRRYPYTRVWRGGGWSDRPTVRPTTRRPYWTSRERRVRVRVRARGVLCTKGIMRMRSRTS